MSDRAPILERIQKLLRLATNNPNEEEARTAAVKAATLMIESGCVVTFPPDKRHEITPEEIVQTREYQERHARADESLFAYMEREWARERARKQSM